MASRGFATRKKTEEAFISEALQGPALQEPEIDEQPYPWEKPGLNPRVQKQYNLRLDEVTLEKLRWVGQNVTVSTHQWVVDILQAAIEEKIHELTDR